MRNVDVRHTVRCSMIAAAGRAILLSEWLECQQVVVIDGSRISSVCDRRRELDDSLVSTWRVEIMKRLTFRLVRPTML